MKTVININPSVFFKTKDIRSDANYWINKEKNGQLKFYDIFEVLIPQTPKFDDLPDVIKYCEIGSLNSSEILLPNDVYLSNINDETDDNAKLYKKMFKKDKQNYKTDDILQVRIGDILISKVRPLLNKVILINEDYKDFYFTKAFIQLRVKDNKISPEVGYYIIKTLLNKEFVAISRIGKSGYPAIKTDDLEDIIINLDIEKLQDEKFNNEIKELHRQKIDAYKTYTNTINNVNESLEELFTKQNTL